MPEKTKIKNDEKLDFKQILPIFVIVLVGLMGLTIIIPLLPLYAAAFGANAVTVGVLAAAYPVMQLIGSPLLGSLSDRYGRRPVLIVSQLGTFAGFMILGFAGSLPMIFLARVIDGLTGGNIVVAQAAITDSTTEKTRTQALGLIGAAFGLGFTIGPAISGIALLLTNNDYRVPAFIAAGCSLVAILLTIFWFEESLPPEKREKPGSGSGSSTDRSLNTVKKVMTALRNPLIGILMVLMFLQQLVFGGFEYFLPLFTLTRAGMDGASNAMLFVYIGFIVVLVQGKFIGDWSRKYGDRKLIFAGIALLGSGMILLSLTPRVPVPWYSEAEMTAEMLETGSVGGAGLKSELGVDLPDDSNNGIAGFMWLLLAMIPSSIGGAILPPAIDSLITKRINAGNIGGALGVSSALKSAANAVTPLIGGVVFHFLGDGMPFFMGGVLMVGVFILAISRVKPGPEEQSRAETREAGVVTS